MKISYTNDALQSLTSLVFFIEEQNTKGAGSRWLNKFEIFLKSTLKQFDIISLCKNEKFKNLLLKCIYYNDWIIAFSVSENNITIEAILHKSRIKD